MVVVPYNILAAVCLGWNLWFNIDLNDWWAEANAFLISNTVWICVYWIESVIISLEWPWFMKNTRIIRLLFFAGAVIYNTIYTYFIFEYFNITEWTEKKDYNAMQMGVAMYMVYNLILHSGNVIINLFVILKEISLEFFQLLRDDAGTKSDDISIGFFDIERMFRDIWRMIDPATYIDGIFRLFGGSFDWNVLDFWDSL